MQKLFFFICYILLCSYSCTSQKIVKNFITAEQVTIREGAKAGKLPTPKFPPFRQESQEYIDYAPDLAHLDHTPMRWIRVNFHFINKTKEKVNFEEEEGLEFSKLLIQTANERLMTNAKMHLPKGNDTPVLPAQYQYVLTGVEGDATDDGVYFHQDDVLFESNKKGGTRSLFSHAQYKKYGVRQNEVLNIFFVEHHPDSIKSPTYKASRDGVGYPHWVKIVGTYQSYAENPKKGMASAVGGIVGVFNHEVGHSMSLRHTWRANDGCEDTPKHSNCWNIDKKNPKCDEWSELSNNLMDTNAWRAAMTPCQIGRVHYKMAKENTTQRKKMKPTWCTYNPEKTIHIQSGEHIVWKSTKDLEGDIVIKKDASLTLQCMVSLPAKAKITVVIGGKLLLDGATLTNRCGQKWEGIEVERLGKTVGTVEIISSSTIENVEHPIEGLQVSNNAIFAPVTIGGVLLFGFLYKVFA